MAKSTKAGSTPNRTSARRTTTQHVAALSFPRPGGELGVIIDHLAAKAGATADELVAATGWQRHSVLGALSKLIKTLSVPARLKRTSLETKLLIQGTFGAAPPRQADRSVLRLIALARRVSDLVMNSNDPGSRCRGWTEPILLHTRLPAEFPGPRDHKGDHSGLRAALADCHKPHARRPVRNSLVRSAPSAWLRLRSLTPSICHHPPPGQDRGSAFPGTRSASFCS